MTATQLLLDFFWEMRVVPVLFLDFVVSHTFCVPEDPACLTFAGCHGNLKTRTGLR